MGRTRKIIFNQVPSGTKQNGHGKHLHTDSYSGSFLRSNRDCIIQNSWKDELHKYITGIVQNNKHKLLAINGMPDHLHILFGFRPAQSLSDLMQDIKGSSSKWINDKRFVKGKFSWQEGYGAFSYSKSDLPNVVQYIRNQEEHHKKMSFTEEYEYLLTDFVRRTPSGKLIMDERFVFKPVDYFVPDGTL